MKKLITLFILTSIISLTGCGSSTPTKAEQAVSAYNQALNGDFHNLLRMAKNGEPAAQFFLARLYEGRKQVIDQTNKYGGGSSRKYITNYQLAKHWHEQAALQNYGHAQVALANIYLKGIGGIKKDNEKAINWYTKAAVLGNPEAQYMLGNIYFKGKITPKNTQKALQYFQDAADQGHSKSSIFLIDFQDKQESL